MAKRSSLSCILINTGGDETTESVLLKHEPKKADANKAAILGVLAPEQSKLPGPGIWRGSCLSGVRWVVGQALSTGRQRVGSCLALPPRRRRPSGNR